MSFSTTVETGVLTITADRSAKIFTQEIRLNNNKNSGPLDWTLGVFYSDLDRKDRFPDGISFGLDGMLLFNVPVASEFRESESIAYFGDVSYAITDQLTVGVGTRYFEDQRNAEIGVKYPQEDFDNLSSKVYLSYTVNDDAMIYTSIAEGFRSGGHNPPPAASFEPEEIINYEIGIKAVLFDRRLSTELALFYSDYTEYQTAAQDLTTTPISFSTLNAGAAEIQGVEWDIQWSATPQLSLGFSGNVTDAEVSEVDITPALKQEGDPMDLVPENSYSLNVDYRFDWSSSLPGFVRLDYNHQGKAGIADRISGFAQEVVYSESVDLINMSVGVQMGSLHATLFGRNLSDEDELLAPSLGAQGPQGRPRTIGVQLDYDF